MGSLFIPGTYNMTVAGVGAAGNIVTESGLMDRRSHDRHLQFDSIRQGERITARCSLCKRDFTATPMANERTDDVLLRLRAQFKAHNCDSVPVPRT
jgi:hypothetical protein